MMRETLLALAWMLAALLCVAAFFLPIFFYHQHSRRRPDPQRRVPVLLYIVLVLVGGAAGFFFGMIEGIDWACSGPAAGNLCGLTAFFVTGPAGAALAVAAAGSLVLLLPGDAPLRRD